MQREHFDSDQTRGFPLRFLVPQAGVSAGLKLEGAMTTPKTLIMVTALLAYGTSLALAQNGPSTSGLPVAGGAATSSAAPGPVSVSPARTAHHRGIKHHRMYMMSVNRTHKGSKLTPANNAKLQKQ